MHEVTPRQDLFSILSPTESLLQGIDRHQQNNHFDEIVDQKSSVDNQDAPHHSSIPTKDHQVQVPLQETITSIALQQLRFKEKIEKIQELSASRRYRNLADEDFELIGDQSHWHERQVSASSFTSGRIYQNRLVEEQRLIQAIDPDGAIYSFLCLLFGSFGFIQFMIAPIKFCFPNFCERDECSQMKILDGFAMFVFSIRIISGFFTAFQMKNILVENFTEIRHNYCQNSLFFDLLPIIQISVNFNSASPILGIIYFFQIFNCYRYIQKFCNFLNLEEKYIVVYHVSRLVTLIFSVAHYNALIFYFVSQSGTNQSITWIQTQDLQNAQWIDIYERALYFIIITMITVGFGDITPVTSRERIYLIIMTLFSCFMFGYAVNTVGALFQQRDFQDTALKKKKYQIKKYLVNRGVDPEIRRKVQREIDYINQMERFGLFDDQIDKILDQVSSDLKQEVQSSISLKILRSCHLLNNILSIKCLNQYTKYMKEKTLTPGEILFKKGTRENKIYFINQGEIEIYLENGNKEEEIILRRIQEKCFLGQMTFLSAEPRETSARSVGVTNVIYFQYEDLKRILVNFPQDFEKVCMKRDKIQFNLTQTENQLRCYICQRIGHVITRCPRITFKPDRGLIWEKQIRSHNLVRKPKQSRHKTLSGIRIMRDGLIKYRKSLIALFIDERDKEKLKVLLQNVESTDREFYLNNPKIEFGNDNEIILDEGNESFLKYSGEQQIEDFQFGTSQQISSFLIKDGSEYQIMQDIQEEQRTPETRNFQKQTSIDQQIQSQIDQSINSDNVIIQQTPIGDFKSLERTLNKKNIEGNILVETLDRQVSIFERENSINNNNIISLQLINEDKSMRNDARISFNEYFFKKGGSPENYNLDENFSPEKQKPDEKEKQKKPTRLLQPTKSKFFTQKTMAIDEKSQCSSSSIQKLPMLESVSAANNSPIQNLNDLIQKIAYGVNLDVQPGSIEGQSEKQAQNFHLDTLREFQFYFSADNFDKSWFDIKVIKKEPQISKKSKIFNRTSNMIMLMKVKQNLNQAKQKTNIQTPIEVLDK